MTNSIDTDQVIFGIPAASPSSVFNGRTGHIVETRTAGVVRVRLAMPVSMEDAQLAGVKSITDLTDDPQHYEIDVLAKYLTDAPTVEPGRLAESMLDLALAARSEVRSMRRRDRSELWDMILESTNVHAFAEMIPESVVTPEDARAWVHAHAAATSFGF